MKNAKRRALTVYRTLHRYSHVLGAFLQRDAYPESGSVGDNAYRTNTSVKNNQFKTQISPQANK
jgi:hypothetical protein